ncbi:ABC transporter permease [Paludicola sp. MB14-C6]|uniref:ABC transporter permease n=1 Tax=Paludihabitans sp. MB14-C6 TaxID=3070656 RepID=UPI0027DAD63D|nr:ABC transporter permease [Paludicola sp. MB14-C6]WMJ24145.1 ABC transporter permease [Paludicola sp. MB14-C6]
MQVYSLFFKILKKNALGPIIMFVVIFASLTVMFSQIGTTPKDSFELTKCRVAVVNRDGGELSKELTEFIGDKAKLKTLKDDEQTYKDSLFFREVDYIAIIPKGFTEAFQKGTPLKIESMQIPDGTNAMLVHNLIDSYLNTAKIYQNGTGEIDYQAIQDDLAISTKVNMVATDKEDVDEKSSANFYMNYFSYPMLSIMILAIPMIMLSINELNVKRRCIASPQKQSSFTIKMLSANMLLMLAVYIVFIMIALIMYTDDVFSIKGLYWILNTFSFSVFSLCFGFFVANMITSKAAIWPIANCAALGLGFLGGAFVPQELLNKSLLKFGVINPVFWFIKANNTIDSLVTFNMGTLSPVLLSFGIQLGFALAFAAMTLVAIKYKRRSN